MQEIIIPNAKVFLGVGATFWRCTDDFGVVRAYILALYGEFWRWGASPMPEFGDGEPLGIGLIMDRTIHYFQDRTDIWIVRSTISRIGLSTGPNGIESKYRESKNRNRNRKGSKIIPASRNRNQNISKLLYRSKSESEPDRNRNPIEIEIPATRKCKAFCRF